MESVFKNQIFIEYALDAFVCISLFVDGNIDFFLMFLKYDNVHICFKYVYSIQYLRLVKSHKHSIQC